MDIVSERRDMRERIVLEIMSSLKNQMGQTKKNESYNFDYESIITAIQAKIFCSRRTAVEYANIAFYKLKITKDFINGKKDSRVQKRLEL